VLGKAPIHNYDRTTLVLLLKGHVAQSKNLLKFRKHLKVLGNFASGNAVLMHLQPSM
jgi:hypothetical protein